MNTNQSIAEKTKRIDIALKYTNWDMEKAKLMAMGSLLDVLVIKGKFIVEDQNKSGVILAFFNFIDEYIPAIKTLIGPNDTLYSKTRIFDTWGIIHKDIVNFKNEKDISATEKLDEDLRNYFVQLDAFPHVQKGDIDQLSSIILTILKDSFESLNINYQIELEKTNSIELELAGIDIIGAPDTGIDDESSEHVLVFDPDSPFGKKIIATESQAQYIVNGSLILSPVKGKLLSEIQQDERIYVLLTAKDPISQKILDTYKSRDDEGNPRPFVGKVVSIINNEMNKGYIIYVIVAKGIYAKIIEEENLRIQTELTALIIKSEDEVLARKQRLTKIFYFMMYGALILLIIALIAVFFL